VLRQFSS